MNRIIALLAIIIVLPASLAAQTRIVQGTVVDKSNNQPLSGVTIQAGVLQAALLRMPAEILPSALRVKPSSRSLMWGMPPVSCLLIVCNKMHRYGFPLPITHWMRWWLPPWVFQTKEVAGLCHAGIKGKRYL